MVLPNTRTFGGHASCTAWPLQQRGLDEGKARRKNRNWRPERQRKPVRGPKGVPQQRKKETHRKNKVRATKAKQMVWRKKITKSTRESFQDGRYRNIPESNAGGGKRPTPEVWTEWKEEWL